MKHNISDMTMAEALAKLPGKFLLYSLNEDTVGSDAFDTVSEAEAGVKEWAEDDGLDNEDSILILRPVAIVRTQVRRYDTEIEMLP